MLGFIRDYFVYIWSIFFKKNNQVPALAPEGDDNLLNNKNTEATNDFLTAKENEQLSINESDSTTVLKTEDNIGNSNNNLNSNNNSERSPQTLKKIKAVSNFHTQFQLSEDETYPNRSGDNSIEEEDDDKTSKKFELGSKTPQTEENIIDLLRTEQKETVSVFSNNIPNKESELKPITPVELPEKGFNHFHFNYKEQNLSQFKADQQERIKEETHPKSADIINSSTRVDNNIVDNISVQLNNKEIQQKQTEEDIEQEEEESEEEIEDEEEIEEEEIEEEEIDEEEETNNSQKIYSRTVEDKKQQTAELTRARIHE